MGHDGPPQQLWKANLLTGAPLAECPMRTLLRMAERDPVGANECERHERLYLPLYEQGVLPEPGGVNDQPARTLAILEQMRATRDAIETKAKQRPTT